MIQHLVLFQFKEEAQGHTKAENMRMAKEKALAMKGEIPQIKQLEVYFSAENAPAGNADFIIVSVFDSMAALGEYQVHPKHVEFGKFITPLREARACMDYEIEKSL